MDPSLVSVMDSIFAPRSIAILGASNNPNKIGWCYTNALVSLGFPRVYPINRHEQEVLGLRAYPSILDVPDEVDLAVLITPAQGIPQAVEECGRKGVRAAVVHASGFSELGAEGEELQREMLGRACGTGIRLIGPNCMGVHCPSTRVSFDCKILRQDDGPVGLISHSGSLSVYLNQQLWSFGLNITGLWSRFHPDLYAIAMKAIDRDPNADAMLVVSGVAWGGDYTRPVFDAMSSIWKPVVASALGPPATMQARVPEFFAARMAPFSDTRRAARALGWLYEYGTFLRRTGHAARAEEFTGCKP